MNEIPLVDLRAQYHSIRHEIVPAIERVLEGMHLFLGPELAAFEREFADYCGCQHGVGVASGTDALLLALRACGIGAGDEVITVANTFIATVEAIHFAGARPVFVDVDPRTYNLDVRQLASVLTPRTRAIIPVHLYGYPADMRPIVAFAREHGLRVIEDASQAQGTTYDGKRVGGFGDIGCFSLYYSKNLGAYGEAGICVTNDAALADSLRMQRDHGSRVRYQHEIMGVNSRLDEIQAAVLRVKLPHLDAWNAARRAHAQHYDYLLRDVVEMRPVCDANASHIYYVYVVQVNERDRFREVLAREGIATGIHYPRPLHLQPACAGYGYTRGMFPVTEAAADRIVSLPMYPELRDEQIEAVAAAAREAVRTVAARAS